MSEQDAMSKYDAYWQSKIDAVLALFDEAKANGTSAPLDLAGQGWRTT